MCSGPPQGSVCLLGGSCCQEHASCTKQYRYSTQPAADAAAVKCDIGCGWKQASGPSSEAMAMGLEFQKHICWHQLATDAFPTQKPCVAGSQLDTPGCWACIAGGASTGHEHAGMLRSLEISHAYTLVCRLATLLRAPA